MKFSRPNLLLIALVTCNGISLWGQPLGQNDSKQTRQVPLPDGAVVRIGTTRMRHLDEVRQIQFTLDGTHLASLGTDQVFSVWDLKTGAETRRLTLIDGAARVDVPVGFHGLEVQLMLRRHAALQAWNSSPATLSDDGKLLIISQMGKVRVLDSVSGNEIANTAFNDRRSGPAAISPDGKLLARFCVNDEDTELDVVAIASGKLLHKLRLTRRQHLTLLTFSADGKYLAGADHSNEVSLWDVKSGKRIRRFEGHKEPITSLIFPPMENQLASASKDAVYFWDFAADEEAGMIPLDEIASCAAAFSPDGAILATTGSENTVDLWDVKTRRWKNQLTGPPAAICALAFSADGKQLAGGATDGTLHLWDVATRRDITPVRHLAKLQPISYLDAKVILVKSGNDGDLQHLEARSGKVLFNFASPTEPKPGTLTAHNGKLRAEIDAEKNNIQLWDMEKRKETHLLQGHASRIVQMTFSPDCTYLASLALDRTLRVWNTSTGKQVRSLEAPFSDEQMAFIGGRNIRFSLEERNSAQHIVMSHDNRTVVCLGQNGTTYVWEMATAKERGRLTLGNAPTSLLVLSPDSRLMATVANHNMVRVWDALRGKMVHGFIHADGAICTLAFSPSTRLLAAGSVDGTIILYDLVEGKEKRRFQGHRGLVNTLLFAPDDTLLSAAEDGTLLVWDLNAPAPPVGPVPSLSEPRLTALWTQLGHADSAEGVKAIGELTAHPRSAMELLLKQMKPTPVVSDARVQQLILDLEHPQFPLRDKASSELARIDVQATPALQKALGGTPSAERVRRIKDVLKKFEEQTVEPENLRHARGVEVLERIGTPDAVALLEILAGGAPYARLTTDAKEAVERIRGKKQT